MSKLGLIAALTFLAGTLSFATFAPTADAGDPPCVRKEFKTELVKAACAKGGQKEAKEVMKVWNKEKGIKSCNDCHTKLAPSYDLKPDGLEKFTKLGGK